MITRGTLIGPMCSPIMGSWLNLQYEAWVSFYGGPLIREWLVTPIALVPLLHACLYLAFQVIITVRQVHSWVRLLKFPTSSCIAPSSTMKASHWGGSFLICTNLIVPCSVTNLCSAFSNRVLLSSSGGQPRAMAISCILGMSPEPYDLLYYNIYSLYCSSVELNALYLQHMYFKFRKDILA